MKHILFSRRCLAGGLGVLLLFASVNGSAQETLPPVGAPVAQNNSDSREASFGAELFVGYPQVMGRMGQSFKANVGFGAKVYFPGILGKDIELFGLVGYQSFRPLSLTNGRFNLIPIIGGVSVAGTTPLPGLFVTAAAGIGTTVGFIEVSGSSANNFRISNYISVYLEPGISYEITSGMFLRAMMPVTFLISQVQMDYLTWSAGFKMLF